MIPGDWLGKCLIPKNRAFSFKRYEVFEVNDVSCGTPCAKFDRNRKVYFPIIDLAAEAWSRYYQLSPLHYL